MRIDIEKASDLLLNGKVVALPTETVYGLAACLHDEKAIEQIFKLKNRPPKNPLIIHVSDLNQILPYVETLPLNFYQLASTFWPGPLTVVLQLCEEHKILSRVRADLQTAAFRIPNHPMTRSLLEKTGPLVMPSANLSGKPSATEASHVENDFGKEFPVLDGGPCFNGIESTILIYKEELWNVIRQGAIPPEDLETTLGYIPPISSLQKEQTPLCPGQLFRHYAPKATLILSKAIPLNASIPVVGFEDRSYASSCKLFSLGSSNAPQMAAHRLYGILRQLDIENVAEALVDISFPVVGLWNSLHERISKAAKKED